MRTKQLPVLSLTLGLILCAAAPAGAALPRVDFATLWVQGEDLPRADQSQPVAADRDLRVQVWHDKGDEDVYERGEAMRLYFRTNADAYVVVYRIDADGLTEVLWPTTRYNDGFVYGGHSYTLPPQGSPERLRASLSKGVEYVEAIASRYPFDLRNLAIDFAFDRDAQERYDHTVAGDPFLAVNDINYAITGLEEDVDYVVTDWAHLYVEERVEYARYSCNQCHNGDGNEVHPYVDRCTQVTVHYDWGWYDSWYSRYGWWPVYYDPFYWYWDVHAYRAWYFPYYRVCYDWPGYYGVYTRPYRVWSWWDSPHCRGDYWTLRQRGVVRDRPLYAVGDAASRERFGDDTAARTRGPEPPSIVRSREGTQSRDARQRTAPVELSRSTPPSRSRGELLERSRDSLDRGSSERREVVGGREGRGIREGGGRVRTDVVRTDHVVRSLPAPGGGGGSGPSQPARIAPQPGDGDRSSRAQRGARRWTQPVIRNDDPQPRERGSSNDKEPDRLVSPPPSTVRDRDRGRDADRGGSQVSPNQPRRETPQRRQPGEQAPRVRREDNDRGSSSSPAPRSSGRDERSRSRGEGSSPAPQVAPPRRSTPPPAPQVAPPRPAPAPREAPAPRGNDPRGGGGSGQSSRGGSRGDSSSRSSRGGNSG